MRPLAPVWPVRPAEEGGRQSGLVYKIAKRVLCCRTVASVRQRVKHTSKAAGSCQAREACRGRADVDQESVYGIAEGVLGSRAGGENEAEGETHL